MENGCRFNGLVFLEKYRGKNIMFVGDSLSLNMWESLACMIHSSVPNVKTAVIKKNGISEIAFLVSELNWILHMLLVSISCLSSSILGNFHFNYLVIFGQKCYWGQWWVRVVKASTNASIRVDCIYHTS